MCKDCKDTFAKTSVGSYMAFDGDVIDRQSWQRTDTCPSYWTALFNYGCLERVGAELKAGHRLVVSYKKTAKFNPTDV